MTEIFPNTVPVKPVQGVPTGGVRRSRKIRQGKKLVDAVAVAKAQRAALYVVLGYIALLVLYFTNLIGGGIAGFGQNAAIVSLIVFNGMFFLMWIGTAVVAGILAHRLKYNIVIIVIACLCMVLPIIGLLLLLSINSKATTILKLTGVHVGLMGVSKLEMAKLYEGACSNCGYDLRQLGSADRCPECGVRPDERLVQA